MSLVFTIRPENTLYFGCRHALKDHHYGEEWEQYASEGKLTYRVAFSRDGPEGVARTYVQHLIKEDSSRIWDLIETRNAWVYISGYVDLVTGIPGPTLTVSTARQIRCLPQSVLLFSRFW